MRNERVHVIRPDRQVVRTGRKQVGTGTKQVGYFHAVGTGTLAVIHFEEWNGFPYQKTSAMHPSNLFGTCSYLILPPPTTAPQAAPRAYWPTVIRPIRGVLKPITVGTGL